MFRAKRADRLKLLYWDGTGIVMTYKRLKETTFTWPAIRDGLMSLNHAQFEALFGRAATSAIASASAMSFFWRFTNGLT